jgi:DNA-directed RNA polymerase subunit RPC12/RpoP
MILACCALMLDDPDSFLGKAGSLPKELVDVKCPRCGFRISQDTEVSHNRDESDFVGYFLKCPQCGNEFGVSLYK